MFDCFQMLHSMHYFVAWYATFSCFDRFFVLSLQSEKESPFLNVGITFVPAPKIYQIIRTGNISNVHTGMV